MNQSGAPVKGDLTIQNLLPKLQNLRRLLAECRANLQAQRDAYERQLDSSYKENGQLRQRLLERTAQITEAEQLLETFRQIVEKWGDDEIRVT
jgi:vacuolar-type H+-ATPase subunit E/Vma4